MGRKEFDEVVSETPVLVPLSQRGQSYGVNYQNRRIGTIRPSIDGWIGEASLQYGAGQRRLDKPRTAVNYLVANYLAVLNAGINFSIDESFENCTIECGYWLIKIDRIGEESWVVLIQNQAQNSLDLDYFPELLSAIVYSFDLILNSSSTTNNNLILEF